MNPMIENLRQQLDNLEEYMTFMEKTTDKLIKENERLKKKIWKDSQKQSE